MAWGSPSGSSMFRSTIADFFAGSFDVTWASDVWLAALYDNSVTPDNDATSANSCYGSGVWGTAGGGTGTPQVYQAGQWPAAGTTLGGASGTTHFQDTADNIWFAGGTSSSGTACTIGSANGCLVYDTTAASKRAISFNYFGGANSVTNGTFSVIYHANGVWRITAALG